MSWNSDLRDVSVVIVEDELIAAEFLKESLEEEGMKVLAVVDTGREAIDVCLKLNPDVIFMDIMLADSVSGSEAAVAISAKSDARIIFLTAYTSPEMVDYAVRARAAGYLTKPYNEAQIIATLRLAMAQAKPQRGVSGTSPVVTPADPMIRLIGGLTFDTEHKRVFKEGRELPLSPKPLKMIELLCRHPDVSVSSEQIAMHVWGELVNDRTLRTLIHRTRAMTHESLIKNVSGTGYRICTKEQD